MWKTRRWNKTPETPSLDENLRIGLTISWSLQRTGKEAFEQKTSVWLVVSRRTVSWMFHQMLPIRQLGRRGSATTPTSYHWLTGLADIFQEDENDCLACQNSEASTWRLIATLLSQHGKHSAHWNRLTIRTIVVYQYTLFFKNTITVYSN